MIGELHLAGVYVPRLLVLAFCAILLSGIASRILSAAGFYRFVSYRALVDLCLFVLMLGLLAGLSLFAGSSL